MIACLPMYCLPQTDAAYAAWWRHIYKNLTNKGVPAPISIDPAPDDLLGLWLNNDLLMSQTCGFPLVNHLAGKVKIIGTPIYTAPGCEGANYSSYFVVHKQDKRRYLPDYLGARFAYNEPGSQSGFNAAMQTLDIENTQKPFFSKLIQSGSHKNSLLAVAQSKADLCAVDCVTHAMLVKYQPQVLENTRILSSTALTPGLPLITSISTSDDTVSLLFNAVQAACNDCTLQQTNEKLFLKGIEFVSLQDYQAKILLPLKKQC